MKKAAHFQQPAPSVTVQDVVHVLILIVLSLLLILVPIRGFGQDVPEPPASDGFMAIESALDMPAPPAPALESAPAPTVIVPATPEVPDPSAEPMSPAISEFAAPPQEAPVPAAATARPVTANQFSPIQTPAVQPQTFQTTPVRQPLLQNPQQTAVTSSEHPFQQYWGVPNDPQTKIAGKPMTVTELFAGTRTISVRCQLLQAYWELSGLLAVYHFRCETERLASGAVGTTPSTDMMTLFQEQRRTAEAEFIKQQWVLAELLKQYKGQAFQESQLPIPTDFPLYPRYQTYADKIARTERTQYLGRMIPIQEQLIETKNGTWKAASGMMPNASQPFFVISDQRTTAFLELTTAIVEYNKMIAEYALETIPSNVSQRQLVGAVVRLPEKSTRNTVPEQPQSSQQRTEGITLTRYEAPAGVAPAGVMVQPAERFAKEFQSPVKTQSTF